MAYKELQTRIKWCRDTSANWTSNNPVLLDGEIIIVDTDSGETRFKIGDGVKTYTQLPFEDEAVRNLINNTFEAALPKSGGTMTGTLTLAADPANNLEAATKQYVDALNLSSQNTWYGTCTTAAATAAKVVTTTTGDFTLKAGATVYVLFNTAHTSTSRITLNVDGTGDIAVNLSSTNGMTAYQIAAKQVICFVYDGESFRVQGGSLATTQYYGLTKLSSSTSSTSTTMAATPSAVKEAYDLAAAALPVAGGTMTGALISQNNTDYTTKQVRNIFLIADGEDLPSGSNGDICLVYTP